MSKYIFIAGLIFITCGHRYFNHNCKQAGLMRCYKNTVQICNQNRQWTTWEDCNLVDAQCIYNEPDWQDGEYGIAECDYIHEIAGEYNEENFKYNMFF